MKNIFKLIGNLNRACKAKVPLLIIAIVAVIGFSMAACGGDDDTDQNNNNNNNNNNNSGNTALNGTWQRSRNIGGYYQIIIDGNNWEYYDGTDPIAKGTWSSNPTITASSTGTITLIMTQIYSGSWQNLPSEYNSIKTNTATYSLNASGDSLTLSNSSLNNVDQWSKLEGTYTKSGSSGVGDNGGGNTGKYIISGGGTSFTATKNGVTVGTANQTIGNVITAIKTDANGANCTIQFGDGTSVLNVTDTDLAHGDIIFNNTGSTWGVITLAGKIAGSTSITIRDNISVNSTANIEFTGSSTSGFYLDGTSTLTISSGTVSFTTQDGNTHYTVMSHGTGDIIISGGTVKSYAGMAIYIYSTGKVTISGGTVEAHGINTAIYNTSGGTVNINSGTVTSESTAILNSGTLTISGGTINTTGTTSYAVFNTSGTATISGGTISATGSAYAVYRSGGTVTIGAGATIIGSTYGIN